MSDTTQAPQIPVKQDLRKVNTPERLERLRLARETRARNRIAKEEKRMELAKQMILASVNPGPGMSTATGKMLVEKKSAEEKKLKWQARKEEMIQETIQRLEANALAMKRAKEPVPEPETESSESEMEPPPAKRAKISKKPVAKPPQKSKKSSSSTATSARAAKKRRPVEPAVSSTEESSESDVEHENVLQLCLSKYAIKPLDSQILQEPSLIPRIPCILNIVSPIGCGKSTLLIRLITQDVFFKGKFHRIVLFSPTVYLDPKWESALNVKGVLKRYPHESTEETIVLVSPVREKKRFTGRIHEDDVYTEYSEEVLEGLVESQISYKNQYGEDSMPRVLIIFEDAGGLNLFKGKSGTRYVQLITTLRHYKISIWTAIQSYKLLPVPVRINCTNLIFFRICNKQEVRKIYDEFPMLIQNFDRFVAH